jgi:hypothetical protein
MSASRSQGVHLLVKVGVPPELDDRFLLPSLPRWSSSSAGDGRLMRFCFLVGCSSSPGVRSFWYIGCGEALMLVRELDSARFS